MKEWKRIIKARGSSYWNSCQLKILLKEGLIYKEVVIKQGGPEVRWTLTITRERTANEARSSKRKTVPAREGKCKHCRKSKQRSSSMLHAAFVPSGISNSILLC